MIRFTTAGESHGEAVVVIVEGIPSGLILNTDDINIELKRRQRSYGRGERMNIEDDVVKILSGVRHMRSIGSPITMLIANRDSKNWTCVMSPTLRRSKKSILLNPRPGHADLVGLVKYGTNDFRDILERASARETVARVAAGAVCKMLLKEFGISVMSYTSQIGTVKAKVSFVNENKILHDVDKSSVRCPDSVASKKMMKLIDEAKLKGDTLGGKIVILAKNVLMGLGSHTQWDLKLDGRLAQSLVSIQAIKSVEFGLGTELACCLGSMSHDEIFYSKAKGFYRKTNRAGGIEGGMSNGEPIVISCTMKAIPSLVNSLKSVNIATKKPAKAQVVRSDVCAVPSAGIVAEAAVAIELAMVLKEKFGGDSLNDMKKSVDMYKKRVRAL